MRLSLKDGKRSYRIGEPIELELSFTADSPGYTVTLDVEPFEAPLDRITLTPADGVKRWIDDYVALHFSFRDVVINTDVSARPVVVTLPLNLWYHLEPGDYAVRIDTPRVRKLGLLTTNPVSFHVAAMTDADEDAEAARLDAEFSAITARDDDRERALATRLSFLTGASGARTQAKWLIQSPPGSRGDYRRQLRMCAYSAGNPEQLRSVLEASLRDPASAVTEALFDTIVDTGLWIETPALLAQAQGDRGSAYDNAKRRTSELTGEYFAELVSGLSARQGEARRETLRWMLTLAQLHGLSWKLSEAERQLLIDEFQEFDDLAQVDLVLSHWKDIRSPALVPALERLLSTRDRTWHGSLLEALIDVAPREAGPWIVREIQSGGSLILNEIRGFTEPTLPELDEVLSARLQSRVTTKPGMNNFEFDQAARLVARFSSASILQDVRELFAAHVDEMSLYARAALLSYFDRWDGVAGGQEIRRLLEGPEGTRLLPELANARFGGTVAAVLRSELETDDPLLVARAAKIMSEHGPAEMRDLLQARLSRWRRQWPGILAPAQTAAPGTALGQVNVESKLTEGLLQGKAWTLSLTEIDALKRACVSPACRSLFPWGR